MLTVAVYHTDERRQQTAAVQLLGAMRQHRVAGKVYTVQNVNTFRRDVENSRFDIICLYTGVPDVEEWLQQEGPEIILLDTPVQELGHYLRYKPAAWLPNDKASAGDALQACLHYIKKAAGSLFVCTNENPVCSHSIPPDFVFGKPAAPGGGSYPAAGGFGDFYSNTRYSGRNPQTQRFPAVPPKLLSKFGTCRRTRQNHAAVKATGWTSGGYQQTVL